MSVRCRVMFGQNILLQKSPVEGVIIVKADGSDSVQELKTKIAVCIRSHAIFTVITASLSRIVSDPSAYMSTTLMWCA